MAFWGTPYGIADPAAALPSFIPSDAPLPSQPVDAAGGAPGSYTQSVLDLFKFGIGAWQSTQAQSNQIDYLKYSTANGQLTKNGIPTNAVVVGSAPAMSGTMMMMVGAGLIVVALILAKKAA